jgi:hypothetical protein
MNKTRRKEIFKIIQKLNKLLSNINMVDIDQLILDIGEIIDEIQMVLDEEEGVRDNIPENLQGGFRYEESEDACDNMYDAISELEDIDDEYLQDEIEECISSAIRSLYNCV